MPLILRHLVRFLLVEFVDRSFDGRDFGLTNQQLRDFMQCSSASVVASSVCPEEWSQIVRIVRILHDCNGGGEITIELPEKLLGDRKETYTYSRLALNRFERAVRRL